MVGVSEGQNGRISSIWLCIQAQAKAVTAKGRGARKRARNGAVGVYGLERPSNVSFATVEYLNEWIRIWI